MDRSPLHPFITSRPAGHKSGATKLEQPRPLQVGPKRKNEPEEVGIWGDRWRNFDDDNIKLRLCSIGIGMECVRGIPTNIWMGYFHIGYFHKSVCPYP